MQSIYTQLRRGFLGLFMLGLLAACQSTPKTKPVFNAEYAKVYQSAGTERDTLCADARQLGLRTLVLPLKLDDAARFSCD